MKTLLLMTLIVSNILISAPSFAARGNSSGGGGDATELRVNEIRADILKWINDGGAKGLQLASGLSYDDYISEMTNILHPKNVVIGFIDKDDTINDELKVSVDGTPKTCRGFISKIDSKPHILCNISRFKNTTESEQYKLIHHEYAGLVNIENNDGAASDYAISTQLTDYLTQQTILKLAVKPKTVGVNLCQFDLSGESKPLPVDSWKRGDCAEDGADQKALMKCSQRIKNTKTDKCEITLRSDNPGRTQCYTVYWSTATLFRSQIQSPEQQRDKACSLVSTCLQKITSSNDPDQHELDLKKSQIISKAYHCNL